MYRFTVSAPGTVLLCGDRKQTCVAASLDMRTVLKFSSFPTEDFIKIKFSSIGLRMKIPLRLFSLHFFKIEYDQILDCFNLMQSVNSFIRYMTGFPGDYEPNNRTHRLSLQAFLFLLIFISRKEGITIKSFIMDVSSELPINENLGYSASFVVCLAACFWRWSRLLKGKVPCTFNSKDIIHIAEYAYICEEIVYSSFNAINVAISTVGKVRVFKEKEQMSNIFLNVPSMKILLVFSNASNKSMRLKINEYLSSFADFTLYSLEILSNKFIETLEKINEKMVSLQQQEIVETNSIDLENYYKYLMLYVDNVKHLLTYNIIHVNQELLKALGMSHSNSDIICAMDPNFLFAEKIASEGDFILLSNSTNGNIQDYDIRDANYCAKIASFELQQIEN
ncbi:KIME kinase, partial [Acromyrmex insinuator]